MNIYSYEKDDNEYRNEIIKIVKKNLLSVFIYNKKQKIAKIIDDHPYSTLSSYEVIILSNKKTLSLLQYCAYYSTPDIIKSLLDNGYFQKKENVIKERFYYTEENDDYIDEAMVQEESDNIDKNIEDNNYHELQKAMYYALLGGNEANFFLLIEYGGKINASISNEWSENNHDTPLGVAIALEKFNLANKIIDLGGDINHIGYGLHYAIKHLKVKQVKYIVDKGGDINLKDSSGRNALFYLVFSQGIYKEKVSSKVYKIIECLESRGGKINWGEPNLNYEQNNKFNLLNGLLSAGNIKKPLIDFCLKKGGFLDPNNIHVRCTTVRMIQSLYNSGLMENIEKYGIDIIKTNIAFNLIRNSFEGLKKIPAQPIIMKFKEIRPELDLSKSFVVNGYNITYPVNLMFYATVERDESLFSYLINNNQTGEIPDKLKLKFNSVYDYLLHLLLIDSYKYKKENINMNKEEDLLKMVKFLMDKGANVGVNISADSDYYPLVLRFLDPPNEFRYTKDKNLEMKKSNILLREKIFNLLWASPQINKEEIIVSSIIFYFKLLYRCSFEEQQLINNESLYKDNNGRKKESLAILEKLFQLSSISKEDNLKRDAFFKKGLVYFSERKETKIYNYLITSDIVKNILLNEKNAINSSLNESRVDSGKKKRRL